MKIVLLSGAGSTGKTTLCDSFEELLINQGYSVSVFKSNTRKTYDEYKLTDEAKALSNEEFNLKFQEVVFDNYYSELVKSIHNAVDEGKDYFICDRSPHDYIGYYLSVFQNTLTIDKINLKNKILSERVRSLYYTTQRVSRDVEFTVVTLPFPTAWSVDTESSDGWRKDITPKNYIWSMVTSNLVRSVFVTPLSDYRVTTFMPQIGHDNAQKLYDLIK